MTGAGWGVGVLCLGDFGGRERRRHEREDCVDYYGAEKGEAVDVAEMKFT